MSSRTVLEALDYAHRSEEALLRRAHAAEDALSEAVVTLREARALIYAHVDADDTLDRIDAALLKAGFAS